MPPIPTSSLTSSHSSLLSSIFFSCLNSLIIHPKFSFQTASPTYLYSRAKERFSLAFLRNLSPPLHRCSRNSGSVSEVLAGKAEWHYHVPCQVCFLGFHLCQWSSDCSVVRTRCFSHDPAVGSHRLDGFSGHTLWRDRHFDV